MDVNTEYGKFLEGERKRMEDFRRERENKKKQDANNYEETKEQIGKLEEKLTNLKEEKYNIFDRVQTKDVLVARTEDILETPDNLYNVDNRAINLRFKQRRGLMLTVLVHSLTRGLTVPKIVKYFVGFFSTLLGTLPE